MNLAITIVAVIVAIIVIVICLVTYSYTQIQINLNNISFAGIDWAPTSGFTLLKLAFNAITGNVLGSILSLVTGVKLNLIFALSNHGIFPVYIPDLSYVLSINGIPVGQGQNNVDTTINAGETKNIPILQDFHISSIGSTAASIVSSGGIANLQVNGIAHLKLLGLVIPIPFQYTKQFSMMDEIKSRINNSTPQNQYFNNQYNNNLPQSSTSLNQQLQTAEQKIQAVQNYQPPSQIQTVSVYTDKTSYSHGSTIMVRGVINPIISDQFVTIQIKNYLGELITTKKISPDSNGDFTIHISLPSSLSDGTYTVIANYVNAQSQTTFVLGI